MSPRAAILAIALCTSAVLASSSEASARPGARAATPKRPSAQTLTTKKSALAAPAPAPPAPPPAAAPPPPAPILAPALPPPTPADASPAFEPRPQRTIALTINPFALIVGRYGVNAEVLVAPHHGIVASGFVQTFPRAMLEILVPDAEIGRGPSSRVGAELGYRFYTGRDGPTGFFAGPSFLAMPIAYPRVTESLQAEVVSFHAYGAAFDLGAQIVTGAGFTFGGGIGVMALAYRAPASMAPPPGVTVPSYPEPHVLPRLLLQAGWAF
ncbi:MAG: hypothetical protein KF819_13255 [Labilithrix sp.]|nr:hypothetical protein [Labilithrix sp.]